MISLLIAVIVLCLILGLVIFIFKTVPYLAEFLWLAYVICAIVIVIFLIELLQGGIALHSPLLR